MQNNVVAIGLLFLLLSYCSGTSEKGAIAGKSACVYAGEEYIVYEKAHKNSATVDFIITHRQGQPSANGVDEKNALFVLKDQENAFFLNILQSSLFIDYGTGPDSRTLRVFDIITGKKHIDTVYSDTIGAFNNDTVLVWIESNDTLFSKCKEHRQWQDNGLGTAIVEEHYLDLSNKQLSKTGKWKCEPRQ